MDGQETEVRTGRIKNACWLVKAPVPSAEDEAGPVTAIPAKAGNALMVTTRATRQKSSVHLACVGLKAIMMFLFIKMPRPDERVL